MSDTECNRCNNQLYVGDYVWIMENNKPVQKVVFAIIKSMDRTLGTKEVCRLINKEDIEKEGYGWGPFESLLCDRVFETKAELLDSL